MKFFEAESGRLVPGTNASYGFSHCTNPYSAAMRDYYMPKKVCDVMHQANRFDINAFNYGLRSASATRKECYRAVNPLAMYKQGEKVDRALQNGEMDELKEWCKKARDLGVVVGVGTH